MPDTYRRIEQAIALNRDSGGRTGQLGRAIDGVITVIVANHPELYYVRYRDGSWVKAFHNGLVPPDKVNYWVDTIEKRGRNGQMETHIQAVRYDLNPSGGTEFSLTVQDEGIALPQRAILNFTGVGVTATDDVVNNRINVSVPNSTFAVRQNPSNPCTLEYNENGNGWTSFANIKLCPPSLRQNSCSGILEFSTDSGTTWEEINVFYANDCEGDPTEPVVADECLGAANAAQLIVDLFEMLKSSYSISTNPSSVAASAYNFLNAMGLVPRPAYMMVGSITSLIGLGYFTSTSFSSGEQEELQCLIYNHASIVGGNLSFNQGGIISDLNTDGRNEFIIARHIVQAMGNAVLNRSGSIRLVTSADCFDCTFDGWCYTFDFEASSHSFGNGGGRMVWSAGVGWVREPTSPHSSVSITKSFTATIVQVVMEYEGTIGGINRAFFATKNDVDLYPITSTESPARWDFPSGLACSLQSRFGADAQSSNTNIIIKRITIRGTGINPFGSDNCS